MVELYVGGEIGVVRINISEAHMGHPTSKLDPLLTSVRGSCTSEVDLKVSRLDASKVHGYLPIKIQFDPHLTFLTGLNGSGKTSALRLLMGLLAPSLDELIDLKYSTASVVIDTGTTEVVIRSTRSEKGKLLLSISTSAENFVLEPAELQLLSEAKMRGESPQAYRSKWSIHPVIVAIRKISTPMFLGLDRKLHLEDQEPATSLRHRREIALGGRYSASNEISIRRITDSILEEANELVYSALSEVREAQERLDANLRNEFLLDSFRYRPSTQAHFPTRQALERFRERQAAVEKAASGLKLPVAELQSELSKFFEKINEIVDSMEREQERQSVNKKKKGKTSTDVLPPAFFVEWLVNGRQADRIFKQVELLEQYVANRAKLHEPIDRFLDLINRFLEQTGKKIEVSSRGRLLVRFVGAVEPKEIYALSSGERQLVVMLAHLSLNKRLADSGVFIVDEPELSLHIGWQEQFVSAIRKANPNVQMILATHSPAIILDCIDNCRTMG